MPETSVERHVRKMLTGARTIAEKTKLLQDAVGGVISNWVIDLIDTDGWKSISGADVRYWSRLNGVLIIYRRIFGEKRYIFSFLIISYVINPVYTSLDDFAHKTIIHEYRLQPWAISMYTKSSYDRAERVVLRKKMILKGTCCSSSMLVMFDESDFTTMYETWKDNSFSFLDTKNLRVDDIGTIDDIVGITKGGVYLDGILSGVTMHAVLSEEDTKACLMTLVKNKDVTYELLKEVCSRWPGVVDEAVRYMKTMDYGVWNRGVLKRWEEESVRVSVFEESSKEAE